jgi:hypothetical protein
MDDAQLDTLSNRGEVSLAGTCWPIPDGTTLTAGPNSPSIKRDALRVPETAYPHIIAAIKAEPWLPLIYFWKELNEHIAELGKAKSNLLQSRQDMAILRDELTQLEATPEFISAVESYVADLELGHEAIAQRRQQYLIEQSAARLEYWSAMLARLRLQTSKVQHVSDTTKAEAITVVVHPSDEQTNSVKGDGYGEIPGTLPRVGIAKVAVKAAWEIECESKTKNRATAAEVMRRLQEWAEAKKESDVLIKRVPHAVEWWAKGKTKTYGLKACKVTLDRWNKSRN